MYHYSVNISHIMRRGEIYLEAALVELVKCTPFGGFALICIAFMSWHYHKQLKAANEMYLKSIEEVKKAYNNAHKRNNKK